MISQDIHRSRPISEAAGRALKQMASEGVEPSPDNYRRYFYKHAENLPGHDVEFMSMEQCEKCCKSKVSGAASVLSRNVDHLLRVTAALGISLDESGERIGESIIAMQRSEAAGISFDSSMAMIMDASRKIGAAIASAKHTVEQYRARIAELQSKLDQTSALVRIDHLTGAVNPRGLQEVLARECANASRNGSPLSFAAIDLDDFSAINNEHGHGVGDMVLQEFAACARTALRTTDSLIRTGGEEFLLIFPGSSPDGAMYVVDRIRMKFQQPIQVSSKASVKPTFSAGFSELLHDEDGKSAINRADQALLVAKRQGKNRNLTWSERIQAG